MGTWLQKRNKSRANGNMPGLLRPRLGTGTPLFLLYSIGQSKLQHQLKLKERGSGVYLFAKSTKPVGKGHEFRKGLSIFGAINTIYDTLPGPCSAQN